MPTRRPSRTPLALLLPLAALVACGPADEAEDAFWSSPDEVATAERGVGVQCVGTDPCSGGGAVYTTLARVGAALTSRGELLQEFVPAANLTPRSVRLVVRRLRPLAEGQEPLLHVAIHGPLAEGAPALSGAAILSGAVPVRSLANGAAAIALSGAGALVSGSRYALLVSTDVPAAGELEVQVGVGVLVEPTYAAGEGWRRSLRRANDASGWGPVRFRPADGRDLAFAFTGGDGTACETDDACDPAFGCLTGTCRLRSTVPLALSPSAPTLYTNSITPFVATGGNEPYAFTITSGGGSLAGASYTAPATAGSATVRVTDAFGLTADAAITIVPESREAPCTGLPANATWNTVSTITQTWVGGAWQPSTAGTYSATGSTTTCVFKCATGTGWTGLACSPLASCQAIYAANNTAPSASYVIDPDGAGAGVAPFTVTCHMGDGGGWTLAFDDMATGQVRQTIDAKVKALPATQLLAFRADGTSATHALVAPYTTLGAAFAAGWTYTGFEADYYKLVGADSGNRTTTIYLFDDNDIIGGASASCSGRQTSYATTPNGLISYGASTGANFGDFGSCDYAAYNVAIRKLYVR